MALIDKLKDTVIGTVRVARAAGQQVQSAAAPAVKQTARLVRTQLDQRRSPAFPPPPTPPPVPATKIVPAAPTAPSAPTPAVIAKNIAPKPAQARTAAKKKAPAKKSAPGAKLPVKRVAAKPDPA